MHARKVSKGREGYGGGGVNVSQQKHNTQNSNIGSMINSSKDKMNKTDLNKSRSNSQRYMANQPKYSTDKEAKHLKTAIRRCGDWTEHVSSSGKHYYFDIKTSASQWEKPKDWKDSHAINIKQTRKSQSKQAPNTATLKQQQLSRNEINNSSGASKFNRSLSASGGSSNTHRMQQQYRNNSATTDQYNQEHIDKDFRSPNSRKQQQESGDRDYRTGKQHRDFDFRSRQLRNSQGVNDKDYRGHSRVNGPGGGVQTTTTGSNGQQLSDPEPKQETGVVFDYSNYSDPVVSVPSVNNGGKKHLNNMRGKNHSPSVAGHDDKTGFSSLHSNDRG